MTTSTICTRSIAAAVAISLAALFSPVASAQTTATTVPVGFITKTVPAATSASSPSSIVVSVPLYATAAFTSGAASIDSATQVTLSSAAWTVNQFAIPGVPVSAGVQNPHLLRVKSGAGAGLFFAIASNTNNQLTVILPPSVSSLVGVIGVGDSCEVVPANTLGSVFGSAAVPPVLASGADPSTADNVLIWTGTTWQTYFWTGLDTTPNNIWKRTGNVDRGNTVIFPDDAVFIVRRSTIGPVSLTFMGTVPSTVEKSEVNPVGSTFLSNRFPVDMTLGGLGLQNIPGWIAGDSPDIADNVFIWATPPAVPVATWQTYYWTGASGSPANIWKRTGNIDRSSTAIPASTGVFLTHRGALLTLTQVLPYTP